MMNARIIRQQPLCSAPLREDASRVRVLHLITHLAYGGIERWLLDVIKRLRNSMSGIGVLCKGADTGPLTQSAVEFGAAIHHIPLLPDHLSFLIRAIRVVRHGGYNLIHNHLEAYSGVGVLLGQLTNIPVISSYHNTSFAPQTWIALPGIRELRSAYSHLSIRYALANSDRVTGCSQAVLQSLRIQSRPSARVIYYGVDISRAVPPHERSALRHSLGLADSAPTIIHVGRFLPQKNHVAVLRVFQQVHLARPDAQLVLVGSGPLLPRIVDTVKSLSLSGSVRFLGLRSDAQQLLAIADVFLFPSLFEGFGLAALEATAAGLPVVGSRIPGLAEVIDDGKNGFLHDPGDTDGMAQSVLRVLADPAVRHGLGEQGRLIAASKFDKSAAHRQLLGLYHECCSYR